MREIAPQKVSHTLPFEVNDRDEFLRQIDDIPSLAVSEEEVDGKNMVRLWAEEGSWPEDLDVPEMVSSNLPKGEVAVFISTSIDSNVDSSQELYAVNSDGEFEQTSSGNFIHEARRALGDERYDVENPDQG